MTKLGPRGLLFSWLLNTKRKFLSVGDIAYRHRIHCLLHLHATSHLIQFRFSAKHKPKPWSSSFLWISTTLETFRYLFRWIYNSGFSCFWSDYCFRLILLYIDNKAAARYWRMRSRFICINWAKVYGFPILTFMLKSWSEVAMGNFSSWNLYIMVGFSCLLTWKRRFFEDPLIIELPSVGQTPMELGILAWVSSLLH